MFRLFRSFKRANYIWFAAFIVLLAGVVVFSVLTANTARALHATSDFPVDVSGLSVTKVFESDGDYVIGTGDGFVYCYGGEDLSAPRWSYEKRASVGSQNPSVVDIAEHGGEIYVAYSDRNVYAFSRAAAGEEVSPAKMYSVGLQPLSIHFSQEADVFAVLGSTGGQRALYIFETSAQPGEDGVVSYRDHPYLDARNGLNTGCNGIWLGAETLYFTTTVSTVNAVDFGAGSISASDVRTVYTGANEFLGVTAYEDGFAAVDRYATLYYFDASFSLLSTDARNVSLSSVFSAGEMFISKVNYGGILGLRLGEGEVFNVSTGADALLVYVSDSSFVYLTEEGGDFRYYEIDLAIAAQTADTLIVVWPVLLAVCALGAVLAGFCTFDKPRGKLKRGTALVAKVFWKHRLCYIGLVPTFLLLAIFYWYPIVYSLILSLFDYLPGEHMTFVGLDNIMLVIRNTEFWLGFKNTLIFLVTDLVKALIPPIFFAELLIATRSKNLSYWMRVLMFIPGVLPGVAGMLVWADGIFGSTSSGLLNGFLMAIFPSYISQAWLQDSSTALTSLIFFSFPWVGSYLIFFGAITGLPQEMFEAAKLDGCGWWRKIVSFDIPLIGGQIKYTFITTFISSVQNYGLIYITTGGDFGTNTPALMMYLTTTVQKNYGVASAMGLFLFAFLMAATIINFRMQFRAAEE